ncbi:oxidoreductase, putative [Plasmodium ovale wallikeri]|uniref:Oxidoreductase, putative n=1 Tax=Plasmodium ovale wallikeri TaxID=864142 RepID=A0A1A8ZCY6_PLAOA|nr:oxidoreductase, putative [Plasmodium ovale wallikeri]
MTSVKHPKISVLGAGDIGCALAHMICEKNLGDVVLHDFRKGKKIATKMRALFSATAFLGDKRSAVRRYVSAKFALESK